MQHPEHSDALQNWVLGEVVDNMNVNIYATDIQNDRILFMNKAMKKAFGLEKPEGEICWKVLQRSRDHRCEFCPIDTLVKRKGGEPVIWEEHNSLNGRLYENCDSLARWSDGRIVHLQQSLDITEMRRLSQAARVDELTGLLNRRAGKEALDATLATARNFGQTVCVCMFDLNCLKEVNDRFGHGEGDRYIASAARRVQTMLQKAE